MSIAHKLQAILDIKQSIRTVLGVEPSVPFSQYPSIIEGAIEQGPSTGVVTEGNDYIQITSYPDGHKVYKATELAEPKNLYEYGGEWFYIIENDKDLIETLRNWDAIQYANDSNVELQITGLNGTQPVTANRLITSRLLTFSYESAYLPDGFDFDNYDPDVFDPDDADLVYFNQYIGSWDLSNATDLQYMLSGMSSFNQDIGRWDVSNVTIFAGLLSWSSFNQDIGGWDVSNATDMSNMFASTEAFNQDISGWDVSNVTDMSNMFASAKAFNQDISGWDVSNVTGMEYMFIQADLFNQDLSGWCVDKLPEKPEYFDHATPAWSEPKPIWGTCPA